MSYNCYGLAAIAFAGFMNCSAAIAQAPAPIPVPRSAPAASVPDSAKPSTAAQVETWTNKQWEAAKKEWAKDKAKWADCRKQSSKQKLKRRKSWSFLYSCMAS